LKLSEKRRSKLKLSGNGNECKALPGVPLRPWPRKSQSRTLKPRYRGAS